jgi:O-antigen ligase
MLTGWRRLLMLPIGVALFDAPRWKMRALWIYIGLIDVCAVLSFIVYASHKIISNYELGIVVRNHATQGMMFAAAAFAAAILLRDMGAAGETGSLSRLQKRILAVSVAVLLVNIVLITPGRSGYLVVLVCAAVWAVSWPNLSKNGLGWRPVSLALATVLVICCALYGSPVARNGIEKGAREALTYQQSSQLTSIGIRLVFLKNTLRIVRQHPWLGVGTGGFRASYMQQIGQEQGWEAVVTTDPHDQFLKILTEQGVVGLLIFIGFIVSAFRQPVPRPFRVIGLGVLCAWCATSLFNSHFSTFSEGRFIFIWCGILLAMQNSASDRDEAVRS